jgi:hypothetical protein
MKMRARWVVFWIAIAAWALAGTAWMARDPRLAASAYDLFSTYNTSPAGMSQAYAYLRMRRSDAGRLLDGIEQQKLSSTATLFRIDPRPGVVEAENDDEKKEESAPRESRALLDAVDEAWVRSGGRLVVGLTETHRRATVVSADCGTQRVVFPLSPPVPEIDVPNCRVLGGTELQQYHALVLNDAAPALARAAIGRGEVILFSLPEALANEHLSKNLELLEWLAGRSRPVYFDETVHGLRRAGTLADLLIAEWRLGPALFLLALAALAHVWRRARRIGAPDPPEPDVRTEAADLVDSVALLYDRAVDHAGALRLYYQSLVRAVHARTGLTGEALERAVRERTAGYDPRPRHDDLSRDEFQRMLKILNRAYETVGYANTR